MSTIKKNHPRFGAQVGDVVAGWECVDALFRIRCREVPGWASDEHSLESAERYAESLDRSDGGHHFVRRITRWRRVREVLRWEGDCLRDARHTTTFLPLSGTVDILLYVDGRNGRIPVRSPAADTPAGMRRFAERIARAYGYEVEK